MFVLHAFLAFFVVALMLYFFVAEAFLIGTVVCGVETTHRGIHLISCVRYSEGIIIVYII